MCIISPSLDVTERSFAVLYVSILGLTRCYKTTFFNIYNSNSEVYSAIIMTILRVQPVNLINEYKLSARWPPTFKAN